MKPYFLALLSAVSLSACAQSPAPAATAKANATDAAAPAVKPGTPDERARDAIRKLNAQVQIDHIGAAPIKGFREVIVGGQVIYVTDDGRYLLQGSLYDIDAQKDLGQASLAEVRRKLLKTIPVSDRIVFAPPNPKYTVSVFTDVECGYCRKLHSDIAEYNRQGIAIQYLAFPRMGLGSADFNKMVTGWCSADRRKALTDAKNGKILPNRNCKNPVTMQYDIGQRAGLTGTPMIITAEGVQMPGYMPPADLRAALDRLAAEAAPKPPGTIAAPASGV
jgi:thiol:disulfide interchange protein DsbC